MIQSVKNHLQYYVVFIILQLLGALLVFLSKGNVQFQMTVIVMMTFLSVGWSLLHHYVHHTLHPKIVLEYVLMGCIGIVVTFLILV